MYYTPYPATHGDNHWIAVIKTKAMSIIDDKNIKVNNEICQGDGIEEIIPTNIIDNDELPILRDSGGAYEVDTESININELNEDNEK